MPIKRNGELAKYAVPDFIGRLTSAEYDSYKEAFGAIQDEFGSLERIKNDLQQLASNPTRFAIPDKSISVQIPDLSEGECNAMLWHARSQLLKLNHSDVFLCERLAGGAKEFAVIELFKNDSSYAQANGNMQVLVTGNNPALVIQDYASNAEHTLRFMASNMVAQAQTIVWERFANQNPARVIRAISERCARAVGEAHDEIQAQILEQRMTRKVLHRQAMGQSV